MRARRIWGAVALIGLLAATTIEGSLIFTAVAVGVFAAGSYLGGYMDETETEGGEL